MKDHWFSLVILLLALPLPARCHETDVRITNFPQTQNIKGSVMVEGTTRQVKRESILLPPSRRADLTDMLHAGKIDTEGYSSVSVYLQGEIRSDTFSSGAIGVLLVPDEEPVVKALKDYRQLQFPLETACAIRSGDLESFSCELGNLTFGFPRYRMYLYNTLNKSAEVSVYLYLKK